MEVLKVHEREVPFARVLGFFFRPKEKHRLGTLFLRALLKTQWLEIKSPDDITTEPGSQRNGGNGIDRTSEIDLTPDSIKVKVEEPAGNDKRIDLLIIGNDFVVCIEFKINHELNNPLKQYIDFTKAAFPKKKHYFLVLSPFRKKPIGEAKKTTEFKLVILSHFFEKIIELLPEHFHGDELAGEYYQYFNDLVRTVENRGIRSTRYHTLTTLCKKLNDSGINSEFQKSNGGYIEMKRGQVSLKIRTKTFGWQLEKWFGSEKCGQENIEATDIGYNELLNRIKTFYKNWINHQPSALHIP
ncbi:PD-(D/E)XK nuclease family protein [Rufibacter quisquiliarum]|uniref:PD-(D/E)XK nuclease superfamily protein n=1 Tax=Rufibacter quisquiliarum TaxID=1549639 RepID=A0A839GKA6_9BACT|nr:PD-(D/E)XK nuclease family protein [Rufibacter quisquiliarum]MBA9078203.1 hypothetical protein [Rufibacter quisquiliarum]